MNNWRARLERLSKRYSRRNLYPLLQEALAAHCQPPPGCALNIGAGGEIPARIREAGIQFLSIDVDPECRPDLVQDVADMNQIADDSMDVVFCLEVLEHVKNPQRAAAELKRVLRAGGVVIGSTPFMLGLHLHPEDYQRFTRYGLKHLFDGFEEVTLVERSTYIQAVQSLLLRLYAGATQSNKMRLLLLLPVMLLVVALLHLADPLIKCRDAATGYFFVYRKPAVSPHGPH